MQGACVVRRSLLLLPLLMLGFAVFLSFKARHQIVESKNIIDLLAYALNGDAATTLVVFDIDNTIASLNTPGPEMIGSDQWFSYQIEREIRSGKEFKEALQQVLPIYHEAQYQYPLQLVQAEVHAILALLKLKKVQSIVVTARGNELMGRTQQQLHELGIDFSTTTLPATAVLDANKNIVLSHGIIFASGANKGEALQLLIQQCSLQSSYKKIVVIDDKLSNLKAIMKAFADDAGITIIGIRYGFVDTDVANYNAMRDCVAQVAAEQETVREIAQA